MLQWYYKYFVHKIYLIRRYINFIHYIKNRNVYKRLKVSNENFGDRWKWIIYINKTDGVI